MRWSGLIVISQMIRGSKYVEVSPRTWRMIWLFTCDGCGIEYAKQEKVNRRNKPTHYHSIECANAPQVKGGVLDAVRKERFRARLGVDYPQQSEQVRQRSKETCMQRYGVENVQQVPEIKQRSCDTFLKRLEKRQHTLGVWTSKS